MSVNKFLYTLLAFEFIARECSMKDRMKNACMKMGGGWGGKVPWHLMELSRVPWDQRA